MSLVSLAIVSHNRPKEEVLYIRDFSSEEQCLDDFEYDLFDLPPKRHHKKGGDNPQTPWEDCSLRHQLLLQVALEKMDYLLRSAVESLQAGLNKVNYERKYVGLHHMQVRFLCCADDCRFYGFTTNTNVKIIIAIEDNILPNDNDKQKLKDLGVESLMTRLHSLYVDYVLNPFSNTTGKIMSKRFDKGVEKLVSKFNHPV